MSKSFIYDEVPYPSYTFAQTSPDRLATMAAFHGMRPADPAACRVLELGCGNGANLLSFAYIYPESEFVGIDLSGVHIRDAAETARQLDIKNTKFLNQDLMNFDIRESGEFDFIIAHGLYSWVPERVREQVLWIFEQTLAPQGVGYVSYNTYPGCHTRQMVREMILYHTSRISDGLEQVRESIDFLGVLKNKIGSGTLLHRIVDQEIADIIDREPENVFHDDLSEFNEPFYFYEFVEQIGKHGLQYLSECHPWASFEAAAISDDKSLLELIGRDLIRREQYLDFVEFRRFRSTLVCRSSIELEREPSPEIIRDFYLSSQVKSDAAKGNIRNDSTVKFTGPNSATVQINHPLTKAALTYLKEIWARSVTFDELIAESSKMLEAEPSQVDIARTASFLQSMFRRGFVRWQRSQPRFATESAKKPKTSAFARWQIARGCDTVTTLAGMGLRPESEPVRTMIQLLDGSRELKDISEAMRKSVKLPKKERAQFEKDLPYFIERNLKRFAANGLLVE
jgi:methyltransferase-like protein